MDMRDGLEKIIRRKRNTAIGLLLAVATASSCGGGGNSPTPGAGETTAEKPEEEKTPSITIILDGWSMAGVPVDALEIESETGGRRVLQLEALDEGEAAKISERQPEALTLLAARMYSADPEIVCGARECSDTTGPIPFEALTKPGMGRVHGELYRAWGVETGAWVGRVEETEARIWFGENYLDVAVEKTEGALGERQKAASGSVIALAISFGNLHPIEAAWLKGAPKREPRLFYSTSEPVPEDSYVPADDFLRGTQRAAPGSGNLEATKLTWMTSPTTGCGTGVICIPGTVNPENREVNLEWRQVCNGDTQGWLQTGRIETTYDYEAPTHQFGMWGDETPDIILQNGTPLWNRTPPYVSGTTKFTTEYAHLYDARGLYDKVGTVWREGEVAPEATPVEDWYRGWGLCAEPTSGA